MTDIELPLQASTHQDDENISFHVLNQDNLPMTIVEDRKFKPFGSENLKRKPNGIVYPTRRIDLSTQVALPKNSNKINVAESEKNGELVSSQGNSNSVYFKSPDDFVKNLDAKLRKLQNEHKRIDYNKKPFFTTVKTGEFLEAPEVIQTCDKNHNTHKIESVKQESASSLYAYASKPIVLSRSPPHQVHKSRCEAAAIAAGLNFSKEFVEDTTKNHKIKKRDCNVNAASEKKHSKRSKNNLPQWNPYFAYAKLLSQEDTQAKETRAEVSERRAIARKKARLQVNRSSQLSENYQSKRSYLKHAGTQTDFCPHENFSRPQIINSDTSGVMTEELQSSEILKVDEAIQVIPEDLIGFDEDLQSVLDILVGKTIENALIEILEEEELAALKEQHRNFLEMRAEEQMQTKEFLESHFIEKMEKNNVTLSLEKYLTKLFPQVLSILRDEGLSPNEDSVRNGVFLPWLLEEVTVELGDILSSEDVLLSLVRDVMKRHKEIGDLMQNPAETNQESTDMKF